MKKPFPQTLVLTEIIEGRLSSIESLAWNRNYDWSQKDRIIREHLNYILKDIESKFIPIIDRNRDKQWIEKLEEVVKDPHLYFRLVELIKALKGD